MVLEFPNASKIKVESTIRLIASLCVEWHKNLIKCFADSVLPDPDSPVITID